VLNTVAIILARGGSKGIPKKNLIDFCGQPLISWTILQAKLSKFVDSVWVSSDDNEILEIAKEYGAKTILRPAHLSSDSATSESAWLHAINFIEKQFHIDIVLGLQPTSPLREIDDLDQSIDLFVKNNYDSLFSANEIQDFFIWENNNKNLNSLNYDFKNRKRRQQIKKKYLENGSFYLFKPRILKENNNRLGGNIGIYLMQKYKMFQIDTKSDLDLCSAIMKSYKLYNVQK
jgi:N-acylneuraminate cytidylyltransferase